MARTKESQKAAGVLTRPALTLVQKAQRAAAKKKAAEAKAQRAAAKNNAAEAKAKKKALHENPRNLRHCSELYKKSR